jgi:hypothetical protein
VTDLVPRTLGDSLSPGWDGWLTSSDVCKYAQDFGGLPQSRLGFAVSDYMFFVIMSFVYHPVHKRSTGALVGSAHATMRDTVENRGLL